MSFFVLQRYAQNWMLEQRLAISRSTLPGLKYSHCRLSLPPLALSALDTGEAAVIQLALEQQIPLVCIDEWKGRRVALAVGLRVMGTLGLLGRAKTLGIVEAVKPFVERALRNGIRYHPELVRKVLESIGE